MMRIGLLMDDANMCYGTLNYFILSIEEILRKQHIHTEHINIITDETLQKHWDAIIGINSVAPSLLLDDKSYIMDKCHCPFFNIIVDSPYCHHNTLKSHMKNLRLIFLDNAHVQYCKIHYLPCKSIEMGYLLGPVGNIVPFECREIDILFTGSCTDFEQIKTDFTSEKYSDGIRNIFLYLIENGIKNPWQSTEEALQDYLGTHFSHVTDDEFCRIMSFVGTWADYYLRSYYRKKIVRCLVEAGLNVTIAGIGWEGYFPECPHNLTLLGAVDMAETAHLTANAKILINVMPWFKHGMHDRIPTAMQNGAVCVTDSSSYIDENFQDGENIVLYRLDQLEQLPDKCRYLLEHPKEAEAIAQAGKRKAELEYTWERFVMNYILKWLNE